MPKKATEGNHLPGMVNGEQVSILRSGDTYISLKMPTKPETVVIPKGYVGVTELSKGAVVSVSVVPEDSKLAHKVTKQLELAKVKK